jgi:hypothetical protein
MDFHRGQGHSADGVANGDAGMRVGGRVDDNGGVTLSRLADPIHDHALVVGLGEIHLHAQFARTPRHAAANIRQRRASIDRRFPLTEQVQVWAIDEKNSHAIQSSNSTNDVQPAGRRALDTPGDGAYGHPNK